MTTVTIKKMTIIKGTKRPIRLMGLACLTGLMGLTTSCSNDEGNEVAPTQKGIMVNVVPLPSAFFEAKQTTRSLPTGYVNYNTLYPTTPTDYSTIGIFPAQTTTAPNIPSTVKMIENESGRHWQSALDIKGGTQYYFYGFMPTEAAPTASIKPLDESEGQTFADGAKIVLNHVSTLTAADVCAVVGVAKSTEATNIESVGIKLGEFGYLGSDDSNSNYVYLLLKHLYAGLHFKTHLDVDYAKLRTIKITRFVLKSHEPMPQYIDLHIDLKANTTGDDPVTSISYQDIAGTEGIASVVLYSATEDQPEGITVPVQTPESFLGCFAPDKCHKFDLECQYDVYDKEGNLIRKNCKAVNLLDFERLHDIYQLEAGDIYTLDLKIQPTYLYVLSDPDLDNPTFVASPPAPLP